ncbi:CdaR family protein [Bacillus litorisediminis]|uniref:CdaR family protein n=1 Tax=Bacillus litorisediminis TaxID=2922713 RepID=UPI001FAB9FC6|nr:CdaR family protein [Bacillus litorisediminis]
MDKFMDSPWFLRIVAFLLALLLYTSVNFQQDDTVQDSNGAGNNSETLEVPVNLYYDTDNLVVTGAPETVTVNIQGPRTIVQSAIRLKDFEVFIDLTNAEIGEQEVQIQIRNLSDKLTATIDPTYVTVSVQEKVTKEFTVEPEFNADILEEGFSAGQPSVEPKTVQITGAKDIVEKISYVKATIDTNGTLDNTVTREARVQVLDRFLNKLDVIVEPEVVDVTIPVRPIEKTVPIVIKREGVLPEGVTVESMTLSEESTTIRATSQEILDQINDIEIPVNMAQLTESREITVPLEVPEGVLLMEPNEVTLTITLTKEVTFTDIPIEIEGLGENEEIEFVNPETGSTNITLIGSPEVINAIEADALQVLIDVSALDAGEHEVELSFTPPQNVDWEISESTVQILIQEPTEG